MRFNDGVIFHVNKTVELTQDLCTFTTFQYCHENVIASMYKTTFSTKI